MKKFVKGLLVSGFAVALLAGCSNKGKSSSSECPQPQPAPVKEEWSAMETRLFELTGIGELPFDYQLSLENLDDTGILYATSASEVTEDDVDTYADKLLEGDVYSQYDAGTQDGLSLDVSALGFDQDAQMYQFYRPYQDKEASFFADVVTIGLDEDSHLRVAAVSAYLPLYAYAGPGLSNGTGIYTLKFTHSEYGVIDFYNMYYGEIVASTTGGNFSQTVPTARAAHPEIVTDVTCGAFANSAVMAPYFYGNTESDQFQANYSIFYIKALDDETGPESYTTSEFGSVITQAMEYMAQETYPYAPEQDWDWGYVNEEEEGEDPDPTKGIWFDYLDLGGFSVTVTYSLQEVSLGGKPANVIAVEFEPSEFELPVRGREMASALGESISYDAQYVSAYEAAGYYISQGLLGEVTEEYDAEAAQLDIDQALYQSEYVGIDQLMNWRQTSATAYQEALTFDGEVKVTGAIFLEQYTPAGSDKTYWTFTVQFQQRTVAEVANGYASYINYGINQAMSAGLITSYADLYAWQGVPSLLAASASVKDLEVTMSTAASAWVELVGVEDLFDILNRLDPDDFVDEGESTTRAEAWEAIMDAYDEVEVDLSNNLYVFRYLIGDCATLYEAVEAGVQPIRDAYAGTFADDLASEGIVADNYDDDDWTQISAGIASFNYDSCFSSSECEDQFADFVEAVNNNFKQWKEKYQDLMDALQAEYANREEEYEASDWTSLQSILSTGATDVAAAIEADNKVDAITAYETARDGAAAIPTKLDTYKEEAKTLLDNAYAAYDVANYFSADWDELLEAYSANYAAIDTATSEAAVDQIEQAAEAAMAAVKTAAERKADGKDELDAYVGSLDQEKVEAHAAAVEEAVLEAKNDIDAASDKDSIDSIISFAKEQIAAIIEA